jgi:hypothetical protein
MAENGNNDQNGNEALPPPQQPQQQPQQASGKQRLRELIAIPERQRTDAEWDELNELEISLAQGNREGAPEPGGNRQKQQGQPGQGKNNPGGGQRKPFQKNNNQKRGQQRGRGRGE